MKLKQTTETAELKKKLQERKIDDLRAAVGILKQERDAARTEAEQWRTRANTHGTAAADRRAPE